MNESGDGVVQSFTELFDEQELLIQLSLTVIQMVADDVKLAFKLDLHIIITQFIILGDHRLHTRDNHLPPPAHRCYNALW